MLHHHVGLLRADGQVHRAAHAAIARLPLAPPGPRALDVALELHLHARATAGELADGLLQGQEDGRPDALAFLLAGLSAWQILKNKANASTPKVMRTGLTLGAVLIPLQILVGDLHGLNTLEHQPQKIAAMEGVWETERGAPLLLFAWPDEATRSNRFELGIPKGASLILTHELDGEIRGLTWPLPDPAARGGDGTRSLEP